MTTGMAAMGTGEPGPLPGRFDAFISYRRLPADTAFVDQVQQGLAGRGKQVWVDRSKIEPASDWAQRIVRGIEASKALVFVLTPESVASAQCLHELTVATEQHKLIIPVLLREVDRGGLPESLARPNWIDFTPGHDAAEGLDQLVTALEEDLEWRDEHARLGVRAKEWADAGQDRSFALRGSDLRAAEKWLGQAAAHKKTQPTAQQVAYVVGSRKVATRTQRTWQIALSAGLAISLALAAVALVQRNQAQTEARLADSRALAAEAVADLSTSPAESLRLALDATKVNPGAQAEQALRLAMAQDRLRMVIRSGTGASALAAWNPALAQIAVTAPHDAVALWSSATGRLTQVLPTVRADPVAQLEYDAGGTHLAAVSVRGYVSIWNVARNGTAVPVSTTGLNDDVQAAQVPGLPPGATGAWVGKYGVFDVYGQGVANIFQFRVSSGSVKPFYSRAGQFSDQVLVPKEDGSGFFTNDGGGGGIYTFTDRGVAVLRALAPPPEQTDPGTNCWLPDDSAIAIAFSDDARAIVQVYSAKTGARLATVPMPFAPMGAVTCSANPAADWVAGGDASGDVLLRLPSGTVVPLYGHSGPISGMASSPDGDYLATASNDGTARIWDASTGRLIAVLPDGRPVISVHFGPSSALALTVDDQGLVRVWDTGVGEAAAALQAPARGQAYPVGFTSSGRLVSGVAVTTSSGDRSQVTSVAVLTWDASTGRLARSVELPGFASAPVPCSAGLQAAAHNTSMKLTSDSDCGIPPPADLALSVPVPRPIPGWPQDSALETLAVAVSPDGRYIAYGQSGTVVLLSAGGRPAATLPVRGTPTGLAFTGGQDELMVLTATAIYLWQPPSRQPLAVIPQPSAPIDAALSVSGNRLAAVGAAGTVEVWDTADRTLLRAFRPADINSGLRGPSYFEPVPLRVALSPDGSVVASGNADGTVFFWNVATGKQVTVTTVSTYPVTELSMAANGSALLAADYAQTTTGVNAPGQAAALDPGTGRVIETYQAPAVLYTPVTPGAALSPDGQFLFSGSLGLAPAPPGGTLAVYPVSGGQALTGLQTAAESWVRTYSGLPAAPWSPTGAEVLAGNSVYSCDACQPLAQLQATAAARIAWAAPLSVGSDHPPDSSPYA